MSKFKQILKELVGTALNVPSGELTDLFEKSEDDINVEELSKKFKDKYRENLNTYGKTQKDEGFKSAERSTSKKFEDSLKSKFSITSDKQGDDLIDEINELVKKAAGGKGKGSEMSDEDIKKTETFTKMENLYKQQVKQAQEDSKKQIDDMQAKYAKKENFAKLSTWADKKLDELGFVFDEDPVRAKNQREDLINKLADLDSDWKDENPILSKEGKRLENEFGHAVEPSDYLEKIAGRYYPKKVSEKRQMPDPNKKDDKGGEQQKKYTGALPKTLAEYDAMMGDTSLSIDDRLAINDHWSKQPAK
ncbi:MAG: hypothetical protein QM802_19925 [Agriterribacter sp.]